MTATLTMFVSTPIPCSVSLFQVPFVLSWGTLNVLSSLTCSVVGARVGGGEGRCGGDCWVGEGRCGGDCLVGEAEQKP